MHNRFCTIFQKCVQGHDIRHSRAGTLVEPGFCLLLIVERLGDEPNCTDGEAVLVMRYECYKRNGPYDYEEIKADFNELYQQMNGLSHRDMDKIIYPVCKLCGIAN